MGLLSLLPLHGSNHPEMVTGMGSSVHQCAPLMNLHRCRVRTLDFQIFDPRILASKAQNEVETYHLGCYPHSKLAAVQLQILVWQG